MAAAARKVNWFAIWMSVGVVVVLVVVAVPRHLAEQPARAAAAGRRPRGLRTSTPRPARSSVGERRGHARHLHRLHVPGLQPVRAGLRRAPSRAWSTTARSRSNIHPIAILDRQSQGTEYLDPGGERDVLRRRRPIPRRRLPFMQAMYAESAAARTRRASPTSRSCRSPQACGVPRRSTTASPAGEYTKFVTTDDRRRRPWPRAPAASARPTDRGQRRGHRELDRLPRSCASSGTLFE